MLTDLPPPLALILIVAGGVGLIWQRLRARKRMFAVIAKRYGLECMKWELMDFPTNILDPLGSWDKAQEVYRGRVADGVLMFFVIHQGWGRQGYERTIVARRYDAVLPLPPSDLSSEVLLLEYGRWRILTLRSRWMSGARMKSTAIEQALKMLAYRSD